VTALPSVVEVGTDRSQQTQGAVQRLSEVMVGSVGWVPRREPVDDELVVGQPQPTGRGPVGRVVALPARAALVLAVVVAVVLVGRAALTWWTTQPQRTTVVAGATHGPPGGLSGAMPSGSMLSGTMSSEPPGSRRAAWPQIPDQAGSGSTSSGSPGSGPVVVDVVGRVKRPGLVRLPEGSRVADAVSAAGGAASGAALFRVNLARRLSDGEQVVIPGPNDPVPLVGAGGGGTGGGAGSGAVGPVDLNTATEQQLDSLPGVGPVTAGRVIAWRAQHGRFTRVDELGEVPGIGPKLLAQLKPLVRV
jgi:competence protein ComEA